MEKVFSRKQQRQQAYLRIKIEGKVLDILFLGAAKYVFETESFNGQGIFQVRRFLDTGHVENDTLADHRHHNYASRLLCRC